jgi:hypothetical protein
VKRVIHVIITICLAFATFVPPTEARLSSNNRRAIVLEAFYALRPSHDGSCDKFINGNCVSNWNYLNNDLSAYSYMKNAYFGNDACFASNWAVSGDPCPALAPLPVASFYSNVALYGYGAFGGSYGSIGRGGQCRYFANLLAYRSQSYSGIFPPYASMWGNVEQDLTKAVEGDILTTNPSYPSTPHTAIVVEIKRSGSTVVGLDLIDANWLSDNGASNREVIGRHLLPLPQPAGKWGLWKGVSYYSEPYIP